MQDLGMIRDAVRLATAPLECAYREGARQMGGFIVSNWVEDKVVSWVAVVIWMTGFVCLFHQTEYDGLKMSLQQYW